MCMKIQRRSIFNLLEYYDCKKCSNCVEDEYILIGYNYIYIYYIFCDCKLKELDYLSVPTNKNLAILLQAVEYLNNCIIIWLDELEKIDDYFNIFETFFDENQNIFIILTK